MARSLLSQDHAGRSIYGGGGGGAVSYSSGGTDHDGSSPGQPVVLVGDESPLTPPGRSRAYSMIGSNYYVAPEVSYGIPYDTAVDVTGLSTRRQFQLMSRACPMIHAEPVLFPPDWGVHSMLQPSYPSHTRW
jgi:serine/threonine protein kinase